MKELIEWHKIKGREEKWVRIVVELRFHFLKQMRHDVEKLINCNPFQGHFAELIKDYEVQKIHRHFNK
jgi:hypothetical protein